MPVQRKKCKLMHIIICEYQFAPWIILYKQLRTGSFQRSRLYVVYKQNVWSFIKCFPAKESFPNVKRLSNENNCVKEIILSHTFF